MTSSSPSTIEQITLGGGCFWCLEAVFELCDGVTAVESGYCNGHVVNPSYEAVCTGTTGHNEVVQVSFDTSRIGFAEILAIFFTIHDPTTLNRQGSDVGTQYRSGIYFTSDEQRVDAQRVMDELKATPGALRGKLVTELLPRSNYSRAEDYHQHYFANHPDQGYCAYVVAPKVGKFRKVFKERVRAA